jgi:hypothetical protein
MSIISRTFGLLPLAILIGFGLGVWYLFAIMFFVTGRLPDVDAILSHLSGLEQILKALGG